VTLATSFYGHGAKHLLYVFAAAGEGRFLAKLTEDALAHDDSSQLVPLPMQGGCQRQTAR